MDFKLFKQFHSQGQDINFVDVGANTGQSAISFLMNCPRGRVVSFEPNKLYEPVLDGVREFLEGYDFQYHMVGLSDVDGQLDLYVPYVDGVPYLQEASMTTAQFEKPWVCDRLKSYGVKLEIMPISASFRTADSMIKYADVVKIDAEGAEMSVLRGMHELIEKVAPIFLIENNDWFAVTHALGEYGYGVYYYDHNVDSLAPMSGTTANCWYLKPEHFSKLGKV